MAGKTVPVTATTPFDILWDAKAIKVSITEEEQEAEEDEEEDKLSRRKAKGKKAGKSRR